MRVNEVRSSSQGVKALFGGKGDLKRSYVLARVPKSVVDGFNKLPFSVELQQKMCGLERGFHCVNAEVFEPVRIEEVL